MNPNGLTAILFPGQGSQREQSRAVVEQYRPDLLELATELIGSDPFRHLAEGTRFAQPAIYCADLAMWARERESIDPQYMAGHSFGEIVALVAAEALSAEDGLRLVVARASLSAECATRSAGGMLAVMVTVDQARRLAKEFGMGIAADNSPRQVVLAGDRDRIESAVDVLQRQAVACTILNVSGAFHTPAMAEAADGFKAVLAELEFHEPKVPVMSCVTSRPFERDEIPRQLAESLTTTVRWREVLLELSRRGVEHFVEVGPGRALTGLVNRTLPQADAIATDERSATAYA